MAAELEQLRVSLVAELVGREAFEQLKREVNQVKAATAGLDTAQKGLGKTVDAAAGAVRQQRQAFAQTGMQINQFAGQVAAGTPIMTAFVQQIGDVAYVVGQAGGAMGRVGTFLQGPWAAAILIGVSVLGPLIAKLYESKKAAEEAESAFSRYMNSLGAASKVADVFTENGVAIAKAKGQVAQLRIELNNLNKTPIEFKGEAAYAAASTARRNRIKTINAEIAAATALVTKKQEEIEAVKIMAKIQQDQQNKINQASKSNAGSGANSQQRAINRARQEAEKMLKEQETIALETRLIMTKGAQQFESSMTKMGDVAGKEIDKFLSEDIKNSISGMSDLFSGIKTQIDDVVYQGADKVQGLSQAMGESFSAGIKGMITGAMTFKQVMSNVIDSVISKLFEMFVVQQITGMIAKGISGLTGITMPGKAIGGPVQGGKPYIVGERGPEMFVPSRSGSIIPNGNLGGGMTINVDARGSADPGAVRAQVELGIAQAAPYIIAAAQNRTLKTAGRARLPGTIG